jgi:hypothetical protein
LEQGFEGFVSPFTVLSAQLSFCVKPFCRYKNPNFKKVYANFFQSTKSGNHISSLLKWERHVRSAVSRSSTESELDDAMKVVSCCVLFASRFVMETAGFQGQDKACRWKCGPRAGPARCSRRCAG